MLRICTLIIITLAAVSGALAQGVRPKEVLLDSGGNPIPNDEWRDCSLSDPLRKDPFTRTVRADGTVELRLRKNLIEGTRAPTFRLTAIDGKPIGADQLAGRVIVLNFWFIGCAGCMDEIPKLTELAAKFPDRDRVIFVAISPDPPASIIDFIKAVPFNYLHASAARDEMARLGVKTYPRNAVIDRDGKIVYWRSTVKAWNQFERVIRAELAR